MKEKVVNYYIDMDGVLADFNREPDGLNRFRVEKDFFKNLKPIKSNVKAVKDLIADGKRVFILSASPNEMADGGKLAWLKKFLPEIKNIILMRVGENKADFRADGDIHILFDDYGKNCEMWNKAADGINRAFQIKPYRTIKRLLTQTESIG